MSHVEQNKNGSAKFSTNLPRRVLLLLSAVCRICGHGKDRSEKVFNRNRTQKSSRYTYESDVYTKQIQS
jgi:hypothetical protein